MHESYDMNVGDALPILDSSLREHDAEITGTFINYVGRTVVASPPAYRSIFGKDNDANCYFIRLNGADPEKVEKELLAVSDNISFGAKDSYKVKFESSTKIYNIIVLVTTCIAILISFMILTTTAGLALGVLVGALLTPYAITYMQMPDLEYVKSFQPVAWAVAAGLEALFSVIINTLVFRKVKDLNLRDIT